MTLVAFVALVAFAAPFAFVSFVALVTLVVLGIQNGFLCTVFTHSHTLYNK
jgi:hypothetical protein